MDWTMGELDSERSGQEDLVELGVPGMVSSAKLFFFYFVRLFPQSWGCADHSE